MKECVGFLLSTTATPSLPLSPHPLIMASRSQPRKQDLSIRILAQGSLPVQKLGDLMGPSNLEEIKAADAASGKLSLCNFTPSAFSDAVMGASEGRPPSEVVSIREISLDSASRCTEAGEVYLVPDTKSGIVCTNSFIGHSHEGVLDNGALFATNFAFLLHSDHYVIPCVSNKATMSAPREEALEKIAGLKKYTETPSSQWYISKQTSDLVPAQIADGRGGFKENPLFCYLQMNFALLTTPHATIPKEKLKKIGSLPPEGSPADLKPAPTSSPKMPVSAYHIKSEFRKKVVAYIQAEVDATFGRIGFDALVCTGKKTFAPRPKIGVGAAFVVTYTKQAVGVK